MGRILTLPPERRLQSAALCHRGVLPDKSGVPIPVRIQSRGGVKLRLKLCALISSVGKVESRI
jgi:hypothetical protein